LVDPGQIDTERFGRVPIVAMTAPAMADDREKSLAAGMNGHVVQPVIPEELFATLTRWITPQADPNSVDQLIDLRSDQAANPLQHRLQHQYRNPTQFDGDSHEKNT
jgi:CheY-like chemotaxis protein